MFSVAKKPTSCICVVTMLYALSHGMAILDVMRHALGYGNAANTLRNGLG